MTSKGELGGTDAPQLSQANSARPEDNPPGERVNQPSPPEALYGTQERGGTHSIGTDRNAAVRALQPADSGNPLGLRPRYRNMSDEYVRWVAVAMMVSPDLETCRALLRDGAVMESRLDQDALKLLRSRGVQI